jgi:hypothetical protein
MKGVTAKSVIAAVIAGLFARRPAAGNTTPAEDVLTHTKDKGLGCIKKSTTYSLVC